MSKADQFERYMLKLINADRADLGLSALKLERNLNDAANDHSEWMHDKDKFSHTGAGGSSGYDRMVDADFKFKGNAKYAENIAIQTERGASGIKDDVRDLHQSLMDSPLHYANLMNPDFKYVGLGIVVGKFDYDNGGGQLKSVAVTQNFAFTTANVDLDGGGSTVNKATNGNNKLVGTSKADKISGRDGKDIIKGKGGKDDLSGDAGQDKVVGGVGADKLGGGIGTDVIGGGAGTDKLAGGKGDDKLYGGKGADVLNGDGGKDRLFGGDGQDQFVFKKGNDVDIIKDFSNNRDTLNLRNLDYSSKNDALDDAYQRGSDIVFEFGRGDKLVIEDMTLSQLADDMIV